jgi:hypothetical protein
MISASKTGYCPKHPDRFPVFNANVCVEPAQKVWFGDLDLTTDEPKLVALARVLDLKIYVLYERDGRFGGGDDEPLLDRAVYSVTPDGVTVINSEMHRGQDGRLHPNDRAPDPGVAS